MLDTSFETVSFHFVYIDTRVYVKNGYHNLTNSNVDLSYNILTLAAWSLTYIEMMENQGLGFYEQNKQKSEYHL